VAGESPSTARGRRFGAASRSTRRLPVPLAEFNEAIRLGPARLRDGPTIAGIVRLRLGDARARRRITSPRPAPGAASLWFHRGAYSVGGSSRRRSPTTRRRAPPRVDRRVLQPRTARLRVGDVEARGVTGARHRDGADPFRRQAMECAGGLASHRAVPAASPSHPAGPPAPPRSTRGAGGAPSAGSRRRPRALWDPRAARSSS
jgi:hypothetical protein